jgi:hypothetical protein
MKFYYVVNETRTGYVEVEADDEDEAMKKLDNALECGEIAFNDPDYITDQDYEDVTGNSDWESYDPDESI